MAVTVKRIYEEAKPADGVRVLVDRLWPRGVSKERAALHEWLKALAPSDELREWFHANPGTWLSFRKRYLKELAAPEAEAELQHLYTLATKRKRVTLLFASKDQEHNNAAVLRDLINGMRKPPTGTGPARASGARTSKVQSMPRR
jgi:uncharacterized protein YeaO (DUF488 family)